MPNAPIPVRQRDGSVAEAVRAKRFLIPRAHPRKRGRRKVYVIPST